MRPDRQIDEVEAVARIGSYSLDLSTGRWTSSKGLNAILGIDATFERSVESWASLIHPSERAAMVAYFTGEVVGRRVQFDRRYRVVRPDTGEERWVHGRGALQLDASGQTVRMFGTIADVTDQQRLLEGLQRSERNLAEAQRLAHIGSWEWDIVTDSAQRSEELHRIYGVEPGSIPDTTEAFLAFVHPDDRDRVQAAERAAMAGSGHYLMEYRGIRPDGGIRIIHDEGELIRDASGAPVRMVGTVQDITDRVAAAEERARLATAVEQTSDSVVITNLAGTIEYVNPAFERASGYKALDVVGQTPRILRSDRQSVGFYRALWRRLARGMSWSGRFLNRRADGSTYEVEATISPIRGASDEINGYVAVERDVTALQAARSSLASEFRERAHVAAALSRLQPAGSAAETAAEICEELMGVPGVDFAVIVNFLDAERSVPLAVRGPDGLPLAPGVPLPSARAAYLYQRALQGPWAEAWRPRPVDGAYARTIASLGIRAMAYAPIRNGEGLLGLVAAGTRDETFARHLVDHLPAVGEFAATASALLSGHLEGDHRTVRGRAQIEDIIASAAFHTVFQPIVDLASGTVVGHEALTRFADGARPDIRFSDAWTVDLGAELELATLLEAVSQARRLPAGGWLDVNVSPRLLIDPERVHQVLAMADRPLIVEITEHATVADYRELRAALGRLGDTVRTAVDDAGAGIANFAHIVELRPDFVKLDISLVHGVGTDLGRQAIVVALRHFAQTTGCRLIAEGIETRDEAEMLVALGVELGQGYWYGRPEPLVDALADRARSRDTGTRSRSSGALPAQPDLR